jgi:aspartyl-tRNA(Asn)/glutamyl-tRNA(Gln) amidotransferase subunit A
MAAQDSEICAFGVSELGRLYRRGELSPVEAAQACLKRIEHLQPTLNAYLSVTEEAALAAARVAEKQFRAGIDLSPMQGIPCSVKDIIKVQGTRTTAASRVLQEAPRDTEDATVTKRLRASGAVLLGKLNLHEFAYGDPDPDGPFGVVQNPRRLGHQCGGSSSGCGAATATGLAVVSIGTDTGGSIRHPAAVCGVYGMKPTFGLVPLTGVIPLSTYLDTVGPLGRSVADVAAGLAAIAGFDHKDRFSAERVVDEYVVEPADMHSIRLGIPENPEFRLGFPDALELIDRARDALLKAGAIPVPFKLERVLEVTDLVRTIFIPTELWPYHEQFLDRQELYGRNFRERAFPGRNVTAAQYLAGKEEEAEIRKEWRNLFDRCDVVILPVNTGGALPHGENTYQLNGKTYPLRAITSAFNPFANATGLPAFTVPVGATGDGLPIAVQLLGPHFSERRLLAVGCVLERALGELVAGWGIEPAGRLPQNTAAAERINA